MAADSGNLAPVVPDVGRRMEDLMEEFIRVTLVGNRDSSILTYRRAFKLFLTFMAGLPVNRETYAKWVDWIYKTLAPVTAGAMRHRVGRFLQYCVDTGVASHNPNKLVRQIKTRSVPKKPRFVTHEEYLRLREAARGSYELWIITLAYSTCMAIVDCCLLKWSEVDMERLVIKKQREKTGVEFEVCFNAGSEIHEWLERLLAAREPEDEYVHELAAAHYLSTNKTAHKNLNAVFKRAKVDKTFHCLRHTMITKLAMSGVPFEVGSRITGIRNQNVYNGYVKADHGTIRRAVQQAIDWKPEEKQ